MKNVILTFVLLGAIFGQTGKISGFVRSSETNQPLVGVSILVEGAGIGADTDKEGRYVILNIPVGKYSLRTSYIGYASIKATNLQVSTGRNTEQNFILSQEAITGEEIVVLADRPLVYKDLTSTQKITTAEEIDAMPVESFLGVLTTQAGVNLGAGGELHIRGGRSNEVGYYIDGVSVANPFFTNSLAVNLSNKALQELKVVSGGFNAEYGNAMSGIVNIQVKEGGKNYDGNISLYTGDRYSTDTNLYTNIDNFELFNRQTMEGYFSGPLPLSGGKLTFNTSLRYSTQDGYLYGIREHTVHDYANFQTDDWYIQMGGDGDTIPMNPSENYNQLLKLTYKFSPKLKFSTQYLGSWGKSQAYVHYYKYNPDGRSTNVSDNNNLSFKVNHAIGRKTFYEAHLFLNNTDYKRYQFNALDIKNPIQFTSNMPFGDDDDIVLFIKTPGNYTIDTQTITVLDSNVYILPNSNYASSLNIRGSPSAPTFSFGGSDRTHTYRLSESIGGKFDITSQINNRHEIKAGFQFRSDQLNERNFSILYDSNTYRIATIAAENKSPSHSYYSENAVIISSYIQDKLEYQSFIMNIGLRYDSFNPKTNHINNLINPELGKIASTKKNMWSPRIGVAFPITDQGIVHFSYGHFYQMPTMRNLFLTSIFGAGLSPSIGYGNLKPQKTVMYEFGLQQQLSRFLAINGSIFFKDIRDLLALQSISYVSPTYGPSSYAVYLNKDYSMVQGITLSLTKRRDPKTKLSAFLDYSFQTTEGNSVTSGSFYYNSLTGVEEEKKIVPLSWDQSHVFNATISITEPGSNGWGLSFIGKMSSGWPYTPNIPFAGYVPLPNSSRKPIQRNIDMRIYKLVSLAGFNFELFLKVYNVLDTRNERYVFTDTGRAEYTFVNRSQEETEGFKNHYGEPGVHTWDEYNTRPDYFGPPRLITIGWSINL
ncbi:MAG: TonB-dependent receptor [Candidatus Marinimicrobia bacterium]|nr:TonB-dependent receptor [Candidatus Neomarinimicrobiota bacterium]